MAGRGRPRKNIAIAPQSVIPTERIVIPEALKKAEPIVKAEPVAVKKVPAQKMDIRLKWLVTYKNGKTAVVLGPLGLIYKKKIARADYKGFIAKVETHE